MITSFSVKALFGIFNHDVKFNEHERITILHGPNGFGKTALLRLLDGFFNSRSHVMRTIPFAQFEICLSDNRAIRITKEDKRIGRRDASERYIARSRTRARRKAPEEELKYALYRNGKEEDSYEVRFSERAIASSLALTSFFDDIPELEREGSRSWRHILTGESLSIEDVMERYPRMFPTELRGHSSEPEWLSNARQLVGVRLIETDRLSVYSRREGGQPRGSRVPAVAKYSEDLAGVIKGALAEYASLSQSLDRTFPARLVTEGMLHTLTAEEIKDRLTELEAKRIRFMSVGLLDRESEPSIQVAEQINEHTQSVLSVYVKDVERKLSVLDEVASKIELLLRLTNQKFRYKKMVITEQGTFAFFADKGDALAPDDLSSGEQHELVLLYELLFHVQPKSLILVDEPELSLHVAWQMRFLEDLGEVARLADFDVVIATHSPQIINDRWDLTVELEGPAE